jgi:cob(I)alamin adenosyltransferase
VKLDRGCIQVYTGDGKGKTSAALGLALRAAGAGLRVFIVQFAKAQASAELASLERLAASITVRRYGTARFIDGSPSPEDRAAATEGLADAGAALAGGGFDVVILDEACIALHYGLFSLEELLRVIDGRKAGVEVVVTGRKAPQGLIDAADLVTEMREVKHYYRTGLGARSGIEK